MEFGPNLRMPDLRAMGDGLFELRVRGREGVGRALLFRCWPPGYHAPCFIKKTQDTPAKEFANRTEKDEESTKWLN